MLNPDSCTIYPSVRHAHAHISSTVGFEWPRDSPQMYELAVRSASEEIFLAFKLCTAPADRPWEPPSTRRLIITHAGVPVQFRRRGVFSRAMDDLIDTLQPDEIEINRILSERMREYALSRGYVLVDESVAGGSYRRKRVLA